MIDFLTYERNFHINNNFHGKTLLGFISTVIIVLYFAIFIIINFREILNKKNPIISYIPLPEKINLTDYVGETTFILWYENKYLFPQENFTSIYNENEIVECPQGIENLLSKELTSRNSTMVFSNYNKLCKKVNLYYEVIHKDITVSQELILGVLVSKNGNNSFTYLNITENDYTIGYNITTEDDGLIFTNKTTYFDFVINLYFSKIESFQQISCLETTSYYISIYHNKLQYKLAKVVSEVIIIYYLLMIINYFYNDYDYQKFLISHKNKIEENKEKEKEMTFMKFLINKFSFNIFYKEVFIIESEVKNQYTFENFLVLVNKEKENLAELKFKLQLINENENSLRITGKIVQFFHKIDLISSKIIFTYPKIKNFIFGVIMSYLLFLFLIIIFIIFGIDFNKNRKSYYSFQHFDFNELLNHKEKIDFEETHMLIVSEVEINQSRLNNEFFFNRNCSKSDIIAFTNNIQQDGKYYYCLNHLQMILYLNENKKYIAQYFFEFHSANSTIYIKDYFFNLNNELSFNENDLEFKIQQIEVISLKTYFDINTEIIKISKDDSFFIPKKKFVKFIVKFSVNSGQDSNKGYVYAYSQKYIITIKSKNLENGFFEYSIFYEKIPLFFTQIYSIFSLLFYIIQPLYNLLFSKYSLKSQLENYSFQSQEKSIEKLRFQNIFEIYSIDSILNYYHLKLKKSVEMNCAINNYEKNDKLSLHSKSNIALNFRNSKQDVPSIVVDETFDSSNLNQTKQILLQFDFINNEKIFLFYKGRKSIKTVFGGVLTFIWFLLTLFIILFIGKNFIFHSNPKLSYSYIKLDDLNKLDEFEIKEEVGIFNDFTRNNTSFKFSIKNDYLFYDETTFNDENLTGFFFIKRLNNTEYKIMSINQAIQNFSCSENEKIEEYTSLCPKFEFEDYVFFYYNYCFFYLEKDICLNIPNSTLLIDFNYKTMNFNNLKFENVTLSSQNINGINNEFRSTLFKVKLHDDIFTERITNTYLFYHSNFNSFLENCKKIFFHFY